jgi:hypothetical protein
MQEIKEDEVEKRPTHRMTRFVNVILTAERQPQEHNQVFKD